jgi:hypothetical protein
MALRAESVRKALGGKSSFAQPEVWSPIERNMQSSCRNVYVKPSTNEE